MIASKFIYSNILFSSIILWLHIRASTSTNAMNFSIETTWDGQQVSQTSVVKLSLKETSDKEGNAGLEMRIESPFYDDPRVPESIPPGSMDKLWDYEVVEAFFLGDDNTYLEIELAPRGHYLLILLKENKKVLKYEIPLKNYTTRVEGEKWTGVALIPKSYFPNNVTRFNAYAIHGSGDQRVYMSLFPVPKGKFQYPDFHRLQPFQPIKIFSSD